MEFFQDMCVSVVIRLAAPVCQHMDLSLAQLAGTGVCEINVESSMRVDYTSGLHKWITQVDYTSALHKWLTQVDYTSGLHKWITQVHCNVKHVASMASGSCSNCQRWRDCRCCTPCAPPVHPLCTPCGMGDAMPARWQAVVCRTWQASSVHVLGGIVMCHHSPQHPQWWHDVNHAT